MKYEGGIKGGLPPLAEKCSQRTQPHCVPGKKKTSITVWTLHAITLTINVQKQDWDIFIAQLSPIKPN